MVLRGIVFIALTLEAVASGQTTDLMADGRFENWVKADGSPVATDNWTIENGVVHHRPGGGDIFYARPVVDFVLTFEWRISPGGNSGVKYRVAKYGSSWLGCEFQIQDDKNDPFNLQSTGGLYAVYEPSKAKKQNPPGEWNQGRIVVSGNRLEHWLNGVLVVSASAGDLDWLQRVGQSKFKSYPGWGQNHAGRLMLQDHGSEVWFRNIRLTTLPEAPIVSLTQPFERIAVEQPIDPGLSASPIRFSNTVSGADHNQAAGQRAGCDHCGSSTSADCCAATRRFRLRGWRR